MSKNKLSKKESLELARLSKLEKAFQKAIAPPKTKTVEEKFDEDLKEIHKLEKLSKKLFNNENIIFDIESKLSKYGNIQVMSSKGVSKKTNYFRIALYGDKYSNYKSYNRKRINKTSEKISNALKKLKLKGEISLGVDFDGKYRSGKFVKFGKTPNFFEPNVLSPTGEDEEVVKEYKNKDNFSGAIYFVHVKDSKYKIGGAGINNDCLWYCINKAIPQFNPWINPIDLKIFLKIDRNAMINIDSMEIIEKKIGKVGINVSGDYSYTSKLGLLKNIHLNLSNNHYTINHKVNSKLNFISFEEKQILMIDYKNNIGYDGKKLIEITDDFNNELLCFQTPYIRTYYTYLNKRDENGKILKDENGKSIKYTIQEEYEKYIKIADDLKLKSNGEINIYKTGTILSTAQRLFNELTKHLNPENILFDEAESIQNCTHGATIFYDEYEGSAYKSDVKSMFPYILSSAYSLIPFQRGIFKKMTESEFKECLSKNIIPYGLYRVEIIKSNNYQIDRWFRFDDENYYTSIDIKHALELGLTVNLLTDGDELDHNVILYPRKSCLKGDEVFKSYIDKLFPLKEQKVEGAKLLLNIMSGAIGELNKVKIKIDENDDSEDIDFDQLNLIPISITSSLDFKYSTYTCVNKDQYYKSNFARFKPFLWSHARYLMTKLCFKHNENIVKCYTDGILSKTPLEYGNQLGQLKYEGYCNNCKIINNANVIGKFTIERQTILSPK